MSHMAVIGAGAWGTALARILAANAEKVTLWTWQSSHAIRMCDTRENAEFLPGFALTENIEPTSDLEQALSGASLVLIAVPSQVVRHVLKQAVPWLRNADCLVSATKGIEEDSLKLMSEVADEGLGTDTARRLVVLSGPSFAKEVALGMPTNVVVAGSDSKIVSLVQSIFS